MAEDEINFLFESGVEDTCPECASARSLFPSESALRAWHNAGHQPSPTEINSGMDADEFGQASGFEMDSSLRTSMDNPFGHGPFVSDDPLISDQYSHENPANNVGPYSGPSSYSINTVAPYSPPGEDEENPGQNVGPYNPPGAQNQMLQNAFSQGVKAAYRNWSNENGWFDGTSKSVYDRISQAQLMLRQAKVDRDVTTEYALEEQINTLYRVANELDESNLNDYLEALPGGSVAMEYDDIADAGMVDFGSFISVESHRMFAEAKDYDWDKFTTKGATQWVKEKVANNPGLLRHESDTRKAAIDYVKTKTMVLTDPIKRAEVIDDFVSSVERDRRQAAKTLEKRQSELSKKAKEEQEKLFKAARENLNPISTHLTVEMDSDYVNGKLNIGEDDGSLLYTAAAEALENKTSDWPNFTTEGAREWFWSQASDNQVMLNHQDITRRAAKDYAIEKTAHVRDSALKNEVVRAFCESVEFLRTAFVHKKAKLAAVELEDTAYQEFEEVFGNEDEILW